MKILFFLLLIAATATAQDTTKVNLLVYGAKTGEVRVIAGYRVQAAACKAPHEGPHFYDCVKTVAYLDCRKQRLNAGVKVIQEIND